MRTLVRFAVCLFISVSRLPAADVTPIDAAFEISGNIEDLRHQSTRGNMVFQVAFQQVSYAGQVTRAMLERTADDSATLWLGLKDMQLSIDRTSLAGSVGQASCGPMKLAIGHRRELWIAFDLKRLDENGQSRLTVQNTRFQLPPDNWAIGNPAWVRTSGLLLNQRNVTEGLQQGMMQNRDKIEGGLIKAAPMLLTRLCQAATDPNRPETKIVTAVRSALLSNPQTADVAGPRPRPRPLDETTASR